MVALPALRKQDRAPEPAKKLQGDDPCWGCSVIATSNHVPAVLGTRTWEEVTSPFLFGGSLRWPRGPGKHQCPLDSLKHRATSRGAVTHLQPKLWEKGEKIK